METKKQFRIFTIFEYEKEQDYLREMHKSGWKFVRLCGFGMYYFEKCTPEDVVYQLDYNAEGLNNKDEYLKMFTDCGWEYLQDYVGYSYFRKPVSVNGETEEIFCDEESRMQMMERVIKGRMLPLLILFLVILLPQFITNIFTYQNFYITALLGVVILLYAVIFATCAIKYIQYKKSTQR